MSTTRWLAASLVLTVGPCILVAAADAPRAPEPMRERSPGVYDVEFPKGQWITAYSVSLSAEDVHRFRNFQFHDALKIPSGRVVLGRTVRGPMEATLFPDNALTITHEGREVPVECAYVRFEPEAFEALLGQTLEPFGGTDRETWLAAARRVHDVFFRKLSHAHDLALLGHNLEGLYLPVRGARAALFHHGTVGKDPVHLRPLADLKAASADPFPGNYKSGLFRLRYPEDSIIRGKEEEWLAPHRKAFEASCRELGVEWTFGEISIFVFNDDAQARELGIQRELGYALPDRNTIFTKHDQSRGHELTHLVAFRVHGEKIKSDLINEGLATLLSQNGDDFNQGCRDGMLSAEPPSCVLFGPKFWECRSGYACGASLMSFLIREYGMEKFKRFLAPGGHSEEERFQAYFGVAATPILNKWMAEVRKLPLSAETTASAASPH